ncbi:unnamed protein product [Rhizopus stolonifer]
MTECMSTTCSLLNTSYKHFRRSSVTQGTISSIAKDVRSTDSVASLLRKRKSVTQLTTKSSQLQKRTSTRPPTVNLRSSRVHATDKAVSNFNSASVRLRLDEKKNKNCTVMIRKEGLEADCLRFQPTKKCDTCPDKRHSSPERTTVGGLISAYVSFSSSSSSASSNSSSSSSISFFTKATTTKNHTETNNNPLWSSAQPLSFKSPNHISREKILQELNSSIATYTHQIQELTYSISTSLSSTPSFETVGFKKSPQYDTACTSQIQECKALIVRQKKLLDKLEELSKEETSSVPTNKPGWLKQVKDSLVNPTGITELVIRQDEMKKKTLISIQGICETIEPSLVSAKLLPADKKNKHHFKYKLDLDEHDRLNKFVLLPENQWQKDKQVEKCQFKCCTTRFDFFQRKHHCRRLVTTHKYFFFLNLILDVVRSTAALIV